MHPQGRTRWSAPLSSNPSSPAFLSILARALLAGEQDPSAIAARLTETLGRPYRFLKPLARRYLKEFAAHTRPRLRTVIRFLAADQALHRALKRHGVSLRLAQWITEPQRMAPVPAARDWSLPTIVTVAELATWLNLSVPELEWFADRKRLKSKNENSISPIQHYHYRVLAKPHGAVRLIEVPKPRLKQMQRQILREILDRIPCHESAHGFRKGHSITSFAAPHVGQAVVLRMDLQNFFPSFSAARVQGLFRTAGYPEQVADLLAGLCTNSAPRSLWRRCGVAVDPQCLRDARSLYAQLHLPQGTPTSPALANCLSYRVDCRLAGLAQAAGATYTRYADDLAFSGDANFARRAERFSLHVAALLNEEGLDVHHRKTRVMRDGVRQYLAGTVVNQRLNVPRPDYDRLKATLTNSLRYGHATQNRDALADFRGHIEGRISFVHMVNPAKALRLRKLFDRIDWG
jgi:RNA-directed DNA polymerase